MQTQLYTSIVYQTRHSSHLINSFYLIFKRLMTSILGLETRSFLQLNPQWQMVEDGDPRKYIIENLCRNIHRYQISSSSFANYALGKTAQNQTNISITEVVNTVLENVQVDKILLKQTMVLYIACAITIYKSCVDLLKQTTFP